MSVAATPGEYKSEAVVDCTMSGAPPSPVPQISFTIFVKLSSRPGKTRGNMRALFSNPKTTHTRTESLVVLAVVVYIGRNKDQANEYSVPRKCRPV